jgi:hypothetical protein
VACTGRGPVQHAEACPVILSSNTCTGIRSRNRLIGPEDRHILGPLGRRIKSREKTLAKVIGLTPEMTNPTTLDGRISPLSSKLLHHQLCFNISSKIDPRCDVSLTRKQFRHGSQTVHGLPKEILQDGTLETPYAITSVPTS